MSRPRAPFRFFFFFNATATTEIYTLSLHDALPISRKNGRRALLYRDRDHRGPTRMRPKADRGLLHASLRACLPARRYGRATVESSGQNILLTPAARLPQPLLRFPGPLLPPPRRPARIAGHVRSRGGRESCFRGEMPQACRRVQCLRRTRLRFRRLPIPTRRHRRLPADLGCFLLWTA